MTNARDQGCSVRKGNIIELHFETHQYQAFLCLCIIQTDHRRIGDCGANGRQPE